MTKNVLFRKLCLTWSKKNHVFYISTGGSMGNIYAVNVARYRRYPEVKTKGMGILQKQLCMFTSEKVQFSYT